MQQFGVEVREFYALQVQFKEAQSEECKHQKDKRAKQKGQGLNFKQTFKRIGPK